MPSPNPTIAVRLPPEMFNKVRELAERDGRSMSNFVEFQLRRLLGPQLEPVFTPTQVKQIERHEARQVTLGEAIAAVVEGGPQQTDRHRASVAGRVARRKRVAARMAKHK